MSTLLIDLGNIRPFKTHTLKRLIPTMANILKEGGEIILKGTREELEFFRFFFLLNFEKMEEGEFHIPVMLSEVLEYLDPKPGDVVVDATAGTGGHTRKLAELVKPNGTVIAIEKDPDTFEVLKNRVRGLNVIPIRGDYRNIEKIVKERGFGEVNHILFDLGISSFLLERTGRGFSYRRDEPLDMRFDPSRGLPASHYLNTLREEELYLIFKNLGEEGFSRRIARKIVMAREKSPITRTSELNRLIDSAVPLPAKYKARSRIYQALRIFVNDELRGLLEGLKSALRVLKTGGKLAVISYHSLEDRIIKNLSKISGLKPLTKKPLRPTVDEIKENPRARSAKLRIIMKAGDIDEEALHNIPLPSHPVTRCGSIE